MQGPFSRAFFIGGKVKRAAEEALHFICTQPYHVTLKVQGNLCEIQLFVVSFHRAIRIRICLELL
jgi:hypothetical protein